MVTLRQGQSGAVAYKGFGNNHHLQNELSNSEKKNQLKIQSILQPSAHNPVSVSVYSLGWILGTALGEGLAPGHTARAVNV